MKKNLVCQRNIYEKIWGALPKIIVRAFQDTHTIGICEHIVVIHDIYITASGMIVSPRQHSYQNQKCVAWKRKEFRMVNGQPQHPLGIQIEVYVGAPENPLQFTV